jgi:hypothetical protein
MSAPPATMVNRETAKVLARSAMEQSARLVISFNWSEKVGKTCGARAKTPPCKP